MAGCAENDRGEVNDDLPLKFNEIEKQYARKLLADCVIPRDRLPYTAHFEFLYKQFSDAFKRQELTRNQFWRLLSSAAKQGGLAKERQ